MPSEPYIVQNDNSDILSFISSEKNRIAEGLQKHGAVLFKNFHVPDALTFEKAAMALDPELKNDYLGTSPRNKLTDYVFSASELPPHYPIMQHCEMSFLPHAPRKLFFWCKTAPEKGGETPTCDFGKVYEDLNPSIRKEFEDKGVTTIRNYSGPGLKGKSVKQLKPWPDMFLTTDKTKVEEICTSYELEAYWMENDSLRLINTRPAMRKHPLNGNNIWFNHTQVFHSAAARMEYSHILGRQKNLRGIGLNLFLKANDTWESFTQKPEERAMHVTFGNGDPIPDTYVKHIIDTIWKNIYITPWEKGDLIMIDNYRTAHGRLPYSGEREVNVCWASDK